MDINYSQVAEQIFTTLAGANFKVESYDNTGKPESDPRNASKFVSPNLVVNFDRDRNLITLDLEQAIAQHPVVKSLKNLALDNGLDFDYKVIGRNIKPKRESIMSAIGGLDEQKLDEVLPAIAAGIAGRLAAGAALRAGAGQLGKTIASTAVGSAVKSALTPSKAGDLEDADVEEAKVTISPNVRTIQSRPRPVKQRKDLGVGVAMSIMGGREVYTVFQIVHVNPDDPAEVKQGPFRTYGRFTSQAEAEAVGKKLAKERGVEFFTPKRVGQRQVAEGVFDLADLMLREYDEFKHAESQRIAQRIKQAGEISQHRNARIWHPEDYEDLVKFGVSTDRAQYAVTDMFGDFVSRDEDGHFVAPRKIWSKIEQTAYDADGVGAEEILDESKTIQGIKYRVMYYNRPFLITARMADGVTKTVKVPAPNDQVAKRIFTRKNRDAEILNVMVKPFDPELVEFLRQRGYRGPVKLSELDKKWIRLLVNLFDIDNEVMIQGDDPRYDNWVGYNSGAGKYYYGAEMGYTRGTAERVKRDSGKHSMAKGVQTQESSDPSGIFHAARHLNRSFLVQAEMAEGGTKKTFRVKAQSERVAREKFAQHHAQAKILSVKEEGVTEEADVIKFGVPESLEKLALSWYEYTSLEDGPEQAAIEQMLSRKGFDIEFAEDYSNTLELTSRKTGKKFYVRIPMEMQGMYEVHQIDEDFKADLKKAFGIIGLAGAIGYGAWLDHLATYDTALVREITRQAQAGDDQAIRDLRNISLRDTSTVEMNRLLNRYGFRSDHERKEVGETMKKPRKTQYAPQDNVPGEDATQELVDLIKSRGGNAKRVKGVLVPGKKPGVKEEADAFTFWTQQKKKAGGWDNIDWHAHGVEHGKKGIIRNPPYGVGSEAVNLYYKGLKSGKQGVAEGHADQQRKIFKKNGKPVGEVGIDRESSPGVGQWYMKCYAYDIDKSGYDSYEEAVAELKHCLKQGVAEAAKWRSTAVAKKVTDPGSMDAHSYDYHNDNPLSSGMKRATSDTETPDYDKRHRADVTTRGPRKGMATRRHIERLKDKIRGKQAYGDKSKPNLPEEVDQMDEQFVIHKGKHEPGTKSSLGGQTLHGITVKDVYTDKKEAEAHAAAINKGRGYKPGDEKNSLYGGVLYQVSPRKNMQEEVGVAEGTVMEGFGHMLGSSKTSYQPLDGVKIIVRHKAPVAEEVRGSRSRNIKEIFIQRGEERFKMKEASLQAARAMARHVHSGGEVYDEIGKAINEMATEQKALANFVRFVSRSGMVNETNQEYVDLATKRVQAIRETFRKLMGPKTYANAVEHINNEVAVELTETDLDLESKFTSISCDQRVTNAVASMRAALARQSAFESAIQEAINKEDFSAIKHRLQEQDAIEFDNANARLAYQVGQLSTVSQDARLGTYLNNISKKIGEGIELEAFETKTVKLCLERAKCKGGRKKMESLDPIKESKAYAQFIEKFDIF